MTRFSPFLILKAEPGATVLLSASVCNDNAMLCIVTAHFGGTATVPREMKEVGMIIRDGGVSPRRTRFRLLHSELTIFSLFWLTLLRFRSSDVSVLPNQTTERSCGTRIPFCAQ